MNRDMVFWGVIIGVAGSAAALVWLLYLLYRNAPNKAKTVNNIVSGYERRRLLLPPPFFTLLY